MNYLLKFLINIVYKFEKYGFGPYMRRTIYFFLHRVIEYRKSTITKNLRIIYPLADESKLIGFREKFYRHLAELIIETLWCYKANKEEILSKVVFKNEEIVDDILKEENNVTILLSHIGNWELFCQWVRLIDTRLEAIILYTPIKNQALNNALLKLRQRFGANLVSTKSTLELFRMQKNGRKSASYFAIDQNPGDPYHQHWLPFFDKSVPVISGAEKFAKALNQKVYFLYVTKSQKYELQLIELQYDPTKTYDLTAKQFALLEKNILENPSLWLLSHNRFKYEQK